MSSSWSLTHNKYSICLYLLTHRKAIYLTWGKNHVCCCTHTCPQPHASIHPSHIARNATGLVSKDNDDSFCLWLCQTDSSRITWWTSVCSEPREKRTRSHGHGSHFKTEKSGVYLFYFKCDLRRGVSLLWMMLASFGKLLEAHIQLSVSFPVLDSPSTLHLSLVFSSPLWFGLTVLFILLNYEFFEGKTFLRLNNHSHVFDSGCLITSPSLH